MLILCSLARPRERNRMNMFTSPAGVVTKYCDEYVCVCLSDRISPEPHERSLPFLCMLPTDVARSSSGVVAMLCTSGLVTDMFFL